MDRFRENFIESREKKRPDCKSSPKLFSTPKIDKKNTPETYPFHIQQKKNTRSQNLVAQVQHNRLG